MILHVFLILSPIFMPLSTLVWISIKIANAVNEISAYEYIRCEYKMPLYIAYQSIYFFKNKHFESLHQARAIWTTTNIT